MKASPIPLDEHLRSLQWLRKDKLKEYLYFLSLLCTGGLFYLVVINNIVLYEKLTSSVCDPAHAEYVCFEGDDRKQFCPVEHASIDGQYLITFEAFCVRYVALKNYESNLWNVKRVSDEPDNFSQIFVHENSGNVSKDSREYLAAVYGKNVMTIPAASFSKILLSNMTNPFFVYQYLAVSLWIYQEYIVYSMIILFITFGSIYFTTKEELFNLERLNNLADTYGDIELINELGTSMTMTDSSLVPGDRFIISDHMMLPCDAILVNGRVVVDESMLTGESVPVTKTPVEGKHKESQLDVTQVLQYMIDDNLDVLVRFIRLG